MNRSLRALTESDVREKKEFLTPSPRQAVERERFYTENLKKTPLARNRVSVGHFNEEKTSRKGVPEEEEQKKPFFKLPKIIKQHLEEEELDEVGLKIVKMKKFFYDPYGCSKSAKLEKVKIRKKIMGIGPENKMILEQFALKNRKIKAAKETSKEEEEKYKMKIYGC